MNERTRFKRGSLATVAGTNREVQVHHVIPQPSGCVKLECRSTQGVEADNRLFLPDELFPCVGPAKVLPPVG